MIARMPLISVPYGLRVAGDCVHLEEHPDEKQTLLLIMDLIVGEMPLSQIALRLNDRGLRTRAGQEWTPVAIFHLLPRTVDAGPDMFSSQAWVARPRQASI